MQISPVSDFVVLSTAFPWPDELMRSEIKDNCYYDNDCNENDNEGDRNGDDSDRNSNKSNREILIIALAAVVMMVSLMLIVMIMKQY